MKRLLFILLLFCGTVQAQFPMPFRTPTAGVVYKYRSITIDYTKVSTSDHTDFPVTISGTYTYLKTTGNGGDVTNANGYDIEFYSDAGLTTKLKWETELYVASTGQVVYYIKIPTLSYTANTVIYMKYGNSSVTTDQSDPTNVWDANFQAVYHLNSLTGESSSNNRPLTQTGTVNQVTGQIGGAAELFGGAANYLSRTVFLTATDNYTMEAWINPTNISQLGYAVFNGLLYNNGYAIAIGNGSGAVGDKLQGINDGIAWYNTGYTFGAAATWYYVILKRESGTTKWYVNGTQTSNTTATAPLTPTSNFSLGSNATDRSFAGKVDEVRVSNSVRSVGWGVTCYNNQSSPSTFYTISSPL